MANPWDKKIIPLDGSYNVGQEFNKSIAIQSPYQAGNVQGQQPQGLALKPSQSQSAGSVYGASQAGVSGAIAESIRLANEAKAKWDAEQAAKTQQTQSSSVTPPARQYKQFSYQAAANPYQGMKSEWERQRFNRSMFQNQADSDINQRYAAARMRAQRLQGTPNAVFGPGRLLDLEMGVAQEQSRAWGDIQRQEEAFDLRKAGEMDNFNRWRSQQMQSFANDDLRNAIAGHQAEISLDYAPAMQDAAYKSALNQLGIGEQQLNSMRTANQFAPQQYRDAEAARTQGLKQGDLTLAEGQARAAYLGPQLRASWEDYEYNRNRSRMNDIYADRDRAFKPYREAMNDAKEMVGGLRNTAATVAGTVVGGPAGGAIASSLFPAPAPAPAPPVQTSGNLGGSYNNPSFESGYRPPSPYVPTIEDILGGF